MSRRGYELARCAVSRLLWSARWVGRVATASSVSLWVGRLCGMHGLSIGTVTPVGVCGVGLLRFRWLSCVTLPVRLSIFSKRVRLILAGHALVGVVRRMSLGVAGQRQLRVHTFTGVPIRLEPEGGQRFVLLSGPRLCRPARYAIQQQLAND